MWLTKPMHTKQIIDNVPKKSTFKEIPIEEIANILLAFKQLSINKPLPKINGLAACHCFCESLLAPDKLNNKWRSYTGINTKSNEQISAETLEQVLQF